TILETAILYVPPELVEISPSLGIQLSGSTLKCSHGVAFGSRFISEGEAFDYLPESVLQALKPLKSLLARSRWRNRCATVMVGRSLSVAVNGNGDSALISLTSATASMPESGVFPTVHYAGFTHERSSMSTFADGNRSSLG